jgi:hypothetical protein
MNLLEFKKFQRIHARASMVCLREGIITPVINLPGHNPVTLKFELMYLEAYDYYVDPEFGVMVYLGNSRIDKTPFCDLLDEAIFGMKFSD